MNRSILTFFILFVFCHFAGAQITAELFSDSHDVTSMSPWGPYSKQYSGITHIEDIDSGRRVDFSVIPGFYRRSYAVPNVLFESGCYPWHVNPSMTEITYRYQLEWRDRVYVDVTYHVLDDKHVLVEMNCVNNTAAYQNLLLHNSASLHYADDCPEVAVRGDEDATLVYGVDYTSYEPAVRTYDYGLVYDGWVRGEKADTRALCGYALRTAGNVGDFVQYDLSMPDACAEGAVAIRYRTADGKPVKVSLEGAVSKEIVLDGADEYTIVAFPCSLSKGDNVLKITALSEGSLWIDSVVASDAETVGNVSVEKAALKYRPKVDISENNYVVKYDTQDSYYGVAWNWPMSEVRQFENSELDIFMRRAVHRHPPKYFSGDRKGHHTAAFLRPIFLAPSSDTTLFSLIVSGDEAFVKDELRAFNSVPEKFISKVSVKNDEADYLPQAEPYKFGQQIFQATLLTNVVYPVYTQRQYIRHFTPGKNWNSLYTWDLGFISWAFNDVDPVKAFETIRAYTMEEGAQSAFLHHGTPLPIQFFAFSDLVTKKGSDDMIRFMYPRLKKYYEYIVGKEGTSSTMMPSGLIRTWDYFYNSGGWDDYPPQHELRTERHLYPHVAPMVSTSYYIRAAKILRMLARHMGLKADEKEYDKDIKKLSSAVLDNAWDEESGYFGYVMHDSQGKPSGIYRYGDGSNFNKGLDGVAPLSAGICPDDKRERLIANIFSPEKMWTPIGISTVDRSASYYSVAGYWNGSVWMPHQLVIWKTMLDCNLPEKATQIAFTALDVWKKECEESYQSFEHFIIDSGRGAGWHNFSGLSSPMANWFASYFKKGTVTTGFDTMLISGEMSEDFSSYSGLVEFDKDVRGKKVAVMVCMSEKYDYKALLDGKPVEIQSPYKGLMYLSLPASQKPSKLEILPVNR